MKSKKYFIFIFFILIILSTALCKQRNLSSPLSRLIGHWISIRDATHYYFGPINSTTKEGDLVILYAEKKIANEAIKLYRQKKGTPLDNEFIKIMEKAPCERCGRAAMAKYQVSDYEPAGLKIGLLMYTAADPLHRMENISFIIEKTGQTMRRESSEDIHDSDDYQYVDNKTSPETN